MKKYQLLLLSALSGVLLGLAWPAIGGFAPFLFIGLVPLLFVEEFIYRSEKGSIFGFAFLSFLIWNALSTWWIYCVSEGFATKILVVGATVLLNSCFMAIIFTLFHFTKRKIGEREGYISLILYWLGFEYLHHHWELTWTWLMLGNGFANYTKWIQWYEYTGGGGGALWILVTNVIFFLLIREGLSYKKSIRENKKLIGILSSLIVIPILISQLIYDNYKEVYDPVNVVVVQPNIDPYGEKYRGLSYKEQLDKLLQLAVSATDSTTRYVVAPETALTENIWENELEQTYSINVLRTFTRQYPSLKFVVGMSSYKMFLPGEELSKTARQFHDGSGWYDAYNSAMQIDNTDQIQIYHKSKLVQGVEFMPYATALKFLEKFALDLGGTTGSLGTQDEPSVFVSPGDTFKIAPVICYESTYGEYVGEYIRKGASLIFVMTNDGWWDDTPGHKQHLAYARLRAIETRRSIARAANTGISCFINQRGDILQPTDWWKPAVIKGTLNANSELTFYTKYGDYIGRIASFLAVLLLVYAIARSLNKTQKRLS